MANEKDIINQAAYLFNKVKDSDIAETIKKSDIGKEILGKDGKLDAKDVEKLASSAKAFAEKANIKDLLNKDKK